MLIKITVNKIKRINWFEKKWQIKTNKNNFQLLSVSATRPREVTVDQEKIPFCNKVTIYDTEFGTRGVSTQMKKRLAMARKHFTKLKRFKEWIRKHNGKSLAIPLCISKTNHRRMQQLQNRALRTATRGNEHRAFNIETGWQISTQGNKHKSSTHLKKKSGIKWP